MATVYVVAEQPIPALLDMQAAEELSGRLSGHESRIADMQKEVDAAKRQARGAQAQSREAIDERDACIAKVVIHAVSTHMNLYCLHAGTDGDLCVKQSELLVHR